MANMVRKTPFLKRESEQRGITVILALLILAAVMLAAVGVIRSVDTAGLVATNIAVTQRCTESTVQGLNYAFNQFNSGTPIANIASYVDTPSKNYYSSAPTPTNPLSAQGIPDNLYNGSLSSSNQITLGTATINYQIERLCTTAGAQTLAQNCQLIDYGVAKSTLNDISQRYIAPLYRITVRGDCSRGATVYVQAIVPGAVMAVSL